MAALCITHQRETFACLDRGGARCARRCCGWTPGPPPRSRSTAPRRSTGSPASRRTRRRPGTSCSGWPATNRRRCEHTRPCVDVQGFLVNRLTGELRTCWASADPLGCVDMRTFDYDDELLAAVGLRRDQLPELHEPGAVLGEITDELADDSGLPPGCRWSPASATASRPSSAAARRARARRTSTWAPALVSGSFSETYETGPEFRVLAGGVPRSYIFETLIGAGTYMSTGSWTGSAGSTRGTAAGPVGGADPGGRRRAAAAGRRRPAHAALLGRRADPVLGHQRSRRVGRR